MRDEILIRPMTPEDVDATYHAASGALYESTEERARLESRSADEIDQRMDRYRHFLRHDPEGAWVAEDSGRIAGAANALVREGLWVLSLFAVGREYRDAGVGLMLLERALGYSAGTRAALIASSKHPAAMRRYARAGFDFHPSLTANGPVRRDALPSGLRIRAGEEQELTAGLSLSPAGPICVRGNPGLLTPYLPSGPFL